MERCADMWCNMRKGTTWLNTKILTSIYLLIEPKIPYRMVCLASNYVIPHRRYERLNLQGKTSLIEKTVINLLIQLSLDYPNLDHLKPRLSGLVRAHLDSLMGDDQKPTIILMIFIVRNCACASGQPRMLAATHWQISIQIFQPSKWSVDARCSDNWGSTVAKI